MTGEEERRLVLEAVERCEPATVADVLDALGLPWAKRGTVRNRLYEMDDEGILINDEGRPMRFALNHDRAPEASTDERKASCGGS